MGQSEEEHLTGQQASRITYTLESSLDSVNKVEETAEQMAKKAGIDEDEIFRITMAVREAAVNAVLHGNSYDPEKRITASFENTGDSLVIRIADQERGLTRKRFPTPWLRRIFCAAPVAASSSFARSWMRYTSSNCIPVPS